jgi:hypothetical protein
VGRPRGRQSGDKMHLPLRQGAAAVRPRPSALEAPLRNFSSTKHGTMNCQRRFPQARFTLQFTPQQAEALLHPKLGTPFRIGVGPGAHLDA